RRVSDLIRDVDDGTLVLKPPFQRRLVWTNIVKDHFLETVSLGLPFPEIFIATGDIDTKTMKRKNLLVDGQQRISTLREYVQGSPDLVLSKVTPYVDLPESQKAKFLDYKVAVRDLGTVTDAEVKDIFARINSTDYALKAMERLNAQFSGEYKEFCDALSRDPFFDRHNVFSLADMRRMRDLDFCVILVTTLLSTYYHRDSLNKEYLQRYNDKFPKGAKLAKQLSEVFAFVEQCGFDRKCRVWKKTDLLTLLVELHALLSTNIALDPAQVGKTLSEFYSQVDDMFKMEGSDEELAAKAPNPSVFRYLKAATKATNDKYAREDRAEVIGLLLQSTIEAASKGKAAGKTAKKAKK
ncbi:MAG: DUF262 domain-containing protein, partial [Nitrososphaera sp.]|nr:DUF262 domain-containing protein [Nitrososphaera sp.]